MALPPRLRTLALAVHLTASIGWLGAVTAFLALAIAGVTSQDLEVVRAACLSMGLLTTYVIVPFALAALATGLVSSLGTKWGLFQHYWVLIKFGLTVVAVLILLKQIGPILELADAARDEAASLATLPERRRPLVHAAGGLVVLLVVQVLGVYKPRGMTPRGRRKGAGRPESSRDASE